MTGRSEDERLRQCEFDVENAADTGKSTGFNPPYTCAVCGAGARDASNLCAPDKSE